MTENSELYLDFTALILFACSSFSYLAALPLTKENRKFFSIAGVLFFAALSILAFSCFREYDGRVWADSSGKLLTLAVGFMGLLAIFRFRIHTAGAFYAPICTLILLLNHYFSDSGSTEFASHSAQNALAGLHVLLAVLGEAFIIVGCALSAVYLRRRRQLLNKNFSEIKTSKFSLERIEELFATNLWLAFVFISLSLITGALYTELYMDVFSMGLKLKVIWGIAVWVLTLVMIILDKMGNWPLRKIAYFSFASLLLLTFFFFGLLFTRPMGGG
ncbi:cytochrome c biogenesis protein CcsA [Oligoflexaceae bacterium]|nr:cytochrome c biogenesis protein CcsA [Oligoflexaceae bacterium]